MLTKKSVLLFLMTILLTAACGGQAAMEMESAPAEDSAGEQETMERVNYAGEGGAQVEIPEQLIIRTGELAIVVEDTEESVAEITALAESRGGWIVSSNLYRRSDDAFSGNLVIRVPVERFNETMAAIQDLALEVEQAQQDSEDVTEEYVDLSARLGNLEATAARVRNFLDEARDVDDALAVNQELSRLESEIEALKGRIQYLEQSAAFSTIRVNLTPDALSQPIAVGGWHPTGVVKEAVETLVAGLQLLATVAIWGLIVFVPLALIVLLPVYLIIRFVRRRQAPAASEA